MERTAYYGLRALLVLYMVDGFLKMPNTEAFKYYGWFISGILVFQIIGGVLGDLLIGNKKAIIVGAVLQALGAFALSIPSSTGLYVGLLLVAMGSGFYTPNLFSNFGKLYLNKTKLMDAGFTMLYFSVNLGAFLGTLTIGYIGEKYSWTYGFIIAGIFMLLSIVPLIIAQEKDVDFETKNTRQPNQRVRNLTIAFVAIGLFWAIYTLGSFGMFDLQFKFMEISAWHIPRNFWSSLNLIPFLPVAIIAIFAWSHFYTHSFFKLAVGFLIGALSFATLLLIPEMPSEKHMLIYMLSMILLSISEVHIAPIIYSILTKNTSPKYLAILFSLSFIPTRLFTLPVNFNSQKLIDEPVFSLGLAFVAMLVVSIGLFVYIKWKKIQPKSSI